VWTGAAIQGDFLVATANELRRGGHTHQLAHTPGCADCLASAVFGPLYDGRDIYWAEELTFNHHAEVFLTRRREGSVCSLSWGGSSDPPDLPPRGIDWDPYVDFAVDHGAVFYSVRRGLFQVAGSRVQWSPRNC
jgi:hypothetical protein